MTDADLAPEIEDVSWGTITMADGQTFKDAKCYPGGARAWDWNETGTSHRPGIQPADVEELVDHGAEAIVLARGMNRRLQVMDQTLEHLEDVGIETHVLETTEAVDRYNALRTKKPTGGLFHSTC
jgi:hypothetical protein